MNNIGHAEIWPLTTTTVPPYTTTNAIFYGRKKFIIIDPAPSQPSQQEILVRRIKERQSLGDKFLGLALTHHHGDHIGSALFLSKLFKVPIWAHEKASAHLSFPITNLAHESLLDLGEHTQLCALYTPGHAESHLVFFDPIAHVLIAGDMITDRGTVLIPPQSGSLKIYLESLEFLTKLDIKIIIPAHGKAISEKASEFLYNACVHRYRRIRAILEVIEDASTSLDATDITLLVYKTTMSDALMFFAQLSVESSLQWLLESGLAEQVNYRWIARANPEEKERLLAYPNNTQITL
jgi:glyoxylase-like metal-dependent hydrolase (beta-lactamase superfamily II)